MAIEILIFALVIIAAAAMVRSTFGFGDALVAMPLLSLFLSVKTASPVVAAMAIVISIPIIIANWQKARVRATWQLVAFSIIGIPIGVIYLKGAGEDLVKIVLAIILIIFSAYKLWRPEMLSLRSDRAAPLFGVISGMLGGAYNTNGPPIIIFGTLRGWDPLQFRAILQGVFLPTNIFIVAGHVAAGLWTPEVVTLFLWSLPVLAVALLAGSRLSQRLDPVRFSRYIYIFLIVIGFVLLARTILG
ncbi:MAG: sulfite exporter TauE/SafE family protein [Candidatus Kapaibacterium sp.]